MRSKFMTGVITGSILGAAASMYSTSKMSPKQRKRIMRRSKKMLWNMMDNINIM